MEFHNLKEPLGEEKKYKYFSLLTNNAKMKIQDDCLVFPIIMNFIMDQLETKRKICVKFPTLPWVILGADKKLTDLQTEKKRDGTSPPIE